MPPELLVCVIRYTEGKNTTQLLLLAAYDISLPASCKND
jgi:hypothetical protein